MKSQYERAQCVISMRVPRSGLCAQLKSALGKGFSYPMVKGILQVVGLFVPTILRNGRTLAEVGTVCSKLVVMVTNIFIPSFASCNDDFEHF